MPALIVAEAPHGRVIRRQDGDKDWPYYLDYALELAGGGRLSATHSDPLIEFLEGSLQPGQVLIRRGTADA